MDRDSDDDGGIGPSTGGNAGFGPSEELQVDLGLNFDEPLDTDGLGRRIWMVKVPKFLLERWQSVEQDNVELGRLRVYNKKDENGQERIAVLLPPNKPNEEPIPTEYFMTIQNKATQNTLIFAEREDASIGEAGWEPGKGRPRPDAKGNMPPQPAVKQSKKRLPRVTGTVNHECNLTPSLNSDSYRSIVRMRQAKAAEPKRKLQLLDSTGMETSRLGIAGMRAAKFDTFIKGPQKAKAEPTAKMVRIPRNELLDALFSAFEEYDYWSMKNLRARTQQPETYLKEVMADIAQLNKRGPYAGMWSLQEAYRKRAKKEPDPSAAAGPSGTSGVKAEEDEDRKPEISDDDLDMDEVL